jgi:hypothetical protein
MEDAKSQDVKAWLYNDAMAALCKEGINKKYKEAFLSHGL